MSYKPGDMAITIVGSGPSGGPYIARVCTIIKITHHKSLNGYYYGDGQNTYEVLIGLDRRQRTNTQLFDSWEKARKSIWKAK